MEKKTSQRIVGIAIVTALVLVILPFAFNGKHKKNQLANAEKSATFPDDTIPPSVPVLKPKNPENINTVQQPAQPTPDNVVNNTTPASPYEIQPQIKPAIQSADLSEEEDDDDATMVTESPKKIPHVPAPIHKKIVKPAKSDLAKLQNTAWVVRMGVFRNKQNAEKLVNKLRLQGYKAFSREKGEVTHVFVGPEFKQVKAVAMVNKLQQAVNLEGIVMMYHPLEL